MTVYDRAPPAGSRLPLPGFASSKETGREPVSATVPDVGIRAADTMAAMDRGRSDPPERLVVLFDRDCGLCQWTVQKLRQLDRGARLDLVALQDAPNAPDPVIRDVAEKHALEPALHVVHRDGRVAVAGAAVLAILDVLPGKSVMRAWRNIPGSRRLLEIVYAIVAGHRDAIGRLIQRDDPGSLVCRVERPAGVI